MSTVPVDTLDGMALDYACAKAQGYEFTTDTISLLAYNSDAPNKVLQVSHTGAIGYAPSRCWRIAGSIIDDVKIRITHNTIHQDWVGSINLSGGVEVKCSGHRPLVAAMRAFVKSGLGSTRIQVATGDDGSGCLCKRGIKPDTYRSRGWQWEDVGKVAFIITQTGSGHTSQRSVVALATANFTVILRQLWNGKTPRGVKNGAHSGQALKSMGRKIGF